MALPYMAPLVYLFICLNSITVYHVLWALAWNKVIIIIIIIVHWISFSFMVNNVIKAYIFMPATYLYLICHVSYVYECVQRCNK